MGVIKKIRRYFKVKQLKKELSYLKLYKSGLHWNMQFDKLSDDEVEKINDNLEYSEREIRVIERKLKAINK